VATHRTGEPTVEYRGDLRYSGQSFEHTVAIDRPIDTATIREAFDAVHESAAGYRMAEPVELVTLRATAVAERETPVVDYEPDGPAQIGTREAFFDGAFRETEVYNREGIPVGDPLSGPAIIEADESTTVVPPAWTAQIDRDGTLRLEREVDG